MIPATHYVAPSHQRVVSDPPAADVPAVCSPRSEPPSFQLTRAADYAVRAAIHLASLDPGGRVTQLELSKVTGVPVPFLAKVLQRLACRELVSAVRGKNGGFVITDEGRAASLLDIVEAIEGPIVLNACLDPEGMCERAARCPAHVVWHEAQRRMTDVLRGAGIAQLARLERARPLPRHDADAGEYELAWTATTGRSRDLTTQDGQDGNCRR